MVIEKRKGDVTISTVILIVLGLVVLVMLIIGFTQGFDTIFGIFDRAPSELQTLASACEVYIQGNLAIDFCSYRVTEVDGKDEIVNCNDPRIQSIYVAKGLNNMSCTSQNNLVAICDQIPADDRGTVKVNNVASDKITTTAKCTAPLTP
ncbi:MAG: hypothetical protein AABX10_04055 [Nanoarchaeota archaeon]